MPRCALQGCVPLMVLAGVTTFSSSAARADLIVASAYTPGVLRYDEDTGAFVGDFVSAGSGGLQVLEDMIFGPDGNLYLSSHPNNTILRYNGRTGAFIDVFVASGSGGLDLPTGMAFGPDGNLYVASFVTHQVLRFDGSTGQFLDTFVSSVSGGLLGPDGLLFGPNGNLYVASRLSGGILQYDATTGAFVNTFVSAGATGALRFVFGPDGNSDGVDDLYLSDFYGDSIRRYSGQTGAFLDTFVGSGSGGLDGPYGLAFGPDANLYVSSFNHPTFANNAVVRYDGLTGAHDPTFFASGGGLHGPTSIAFLAPTPVPEPSSLSLLAMGTLGLMGYGWRRRGCRSSATYLSGA